MINFNNKTLFIVLLLFTGVITTIWNTSQLTLVKELTNSRVWMINFIIIIIFSIYIFVKNSDNYTMEKEEAKKHLEALQKALVAFVIALMVHFRLIIAPFWIVFFLAYYLDGWA